MLGFGVRWKTVFLLESLFSISLNFFSSGVSAADGEGASSEAIKARIRALCEAEDPKKVLSDQKLADLLNKEGFDLARRTVAKYREAIGIGSSAQRRRQKKLAAI